MMRIAAAALVALVAGCGGKQTPSSPHNGDAADAAPAAVSEADAGDRIDEPSSPDAELSAAECDRFVDHVVEIAARTLAERASRPGPDGKPDPEAANTEDEIIAVKAKLRSDLRAQCMAVPRSLFECAMKATDDAALGACQTDGGEAAPPN